jgi:hypothetical protein
MLFGYYKESRNSNFLKEEKLLSFILQMMTRLKSRFLDSNTPMTCNPCKGFSFKGQFDLSENLTEQTNEKFPVHRKSFLLLKIVPKPVQLLETLIKVGALKGFLLLIVWRAPPSG